MRGASARKRKSRANQTEEAKKNENERRRKTRANQTAEEKKKEAERMSKTRAQKQTDQFYTKEELEKLDADGPQPVSEEQRQAVMRAAYDAFHQPAVACAVCDQLHAF